MSIKETPQKIEKPQHLLSRRQVISGGAAAVVGLIVGCGDDDRSGSTNKSIARKYMDGVAPNELKEEDVRLKDRFERFFSDSASKLLGNEVGFFGNGGTVFENGHAIECKVNGEGGSQTIVRFISFHEGKNAAIELEQHEPDKEPNVQTIYNETLFWGATEIPDRVYPLRWIKDWEDPQIVEKKEWLEFEKKVRAVVNQATEDKTARLLSLSGEEQTAATAELVEKYDDYSQQAIDLEFKNLDGGGRHFPYPQTSAFDQVSQIALLNIRNDEKQQLVLRNFFLLRDPDDVGITNPTTRTIFINDGEEIQGTIFIGQDRTAWWYDRPNGPVWSPLTQEELNKVSQAMTNVFERAKLKEKL